ncbi:hypothetical protein GCK72_011890 [Caenorhabditis remanei]|uniref:W02B3.4-like N-terminal domain-containing protein n=1 Tax=Caenorhabditis remanei TaxID=31234 RepID=A0A6A5HB13_CAERE|nr:hypothetical protein GCK72_011890 [Caenorhabditis remanei]KAF1763623.1 hypothetical protein GCK72_011890 [Caenorhabditis remanei]
MKKYSTFIKYCCFLSVLLLFYYNELLTKPVIEQEIDYISCDSLLEYLSPPIPALLIDIEVLEQIERDHCHLQKEKSVNIGVDTYYKSEEASLSKDLRFRVFFYTISTKKDYLDFDIIGKKKLIPNGMSSFLTGSTLLSWYQQCTINSAHLELAVSSEELPYHFGKKLEAESIFNNFQVSRLDGTTENVQRIGVKSAFKTTIDIVVVYEDEESIKNFIFDSRGTKKYFSNYDPYCSTDVHGHLFWVTCSPEKRLTEEFGDRWRENTNYNISGK